MLGVSQTKLNPVLNGHRQPAAGFEAEAAAFDRGARPRLDECSCWANKCSGSAEGEADGAAGAKFEALLMSPGGVTGLERRPRSGSFTFVSEIDQRFVPVICSRKTSWVSQCEANPCPSGGVQPRQRRHALVEAD